MRWIFPAFFALLQRQRERDCRKYCQVQFDMLEELNIIFCICLKSEEIPRICNFMKYITQFDRMMNQKINVPINFFTHFSILGQKKIFLIENIQVPNYKPNSLRYLKFIPPPLSPQFYRDSPQLALISISPRKQMLLVGIFAFFSSLGRVNFRLSLRARHPRAKSLQLHTRTRRLAYITNRYIPALTDARCKLAPLSRLVNRPEDETLSARLQHIPFPLPRNQTPPPPPPPTITLSTVGNLSQQRVARIKQP